MLGRRTLEGELRTPEVTARVSPLSALAAVRTWLLEAQRRAGREGGLVADGRDMASVVFPDSVLKIFLTASAEARAERRYKQLKEKGIDANIRTLLQELRERDERDSARSTAPLKKAADARELDSTGLGIDEVVSQVLEWHRQIAARVAGSDR